MTQPEDPKVVAMSDAVLAQRLLDGDETSFEALFERHYSMVYGVLFRVVGNRGDAEDLAQEVFLKLLYRPPQHTENLAGWLYRVALNTAYNALKAEQRRLRRERTVLPGPPATSDPSYAEVVHRETRRQVQRVLARMPRRAAQMLILREMGLSYREIANVVNVAPGSVGKLLDRARKTFLKHYDRIDGKVGPANEGERDATSE
ncbi:MAG: sigma-70 family RNA polymerase sigma factor [Chloroflexi bacterium]|nr:sigma-70 family RNA polymerase sigma factor [Chloroflexota bacterium]